MTDSQYPQGPSAERPQRTNPEMSTDRDALNFVRKRRLRSPSSGKGLWKFQLTLPFKIGAIALIFTGVVLSIWMLKSGHTPVEDDDLPVISADLNMDDFKVAPGDDDEIHIPHSDKEFYSELDSSTSQTKETLIKAAERPAEQVSQEALFAEGSLSKSQKETVIPPTKESEKVDVKVVENANDEAKKTYKAPAPTVSVNKPKKTLEMAIKETQNDIRLKAKGLVHDKTLSQKNVALKKTSKAVGGSGYWVQVASLPTQATARQEARRLQGKSKKELKSETYRTVRVDLGKPKGIRYRVHFGPFSRSKAVQKCKNLTGNEKISCLVVKG